MIISGNKIARAIRNELKEYIAGMNGEKKNISLHIFVVGDDPVIENFVMKKKQFAKGLGVTFVEHRFEKDVEQYVLLRSIKKVIKTFRELSGTFGVVVQLPLPEHVDTQEVLDSVPAELDIDGLGSNSIFLEPVAGAVAEILYRKDIEVAEKQALVVGSGQLVGKPVAKLLCALGAIVTVVNKNTNHNELTKLCKKSDIIVSGAGVPNLIQPHMIKKGCTLLDAGTSTQAGSVVGDIAYECKDKARYFARTPGGIGPVTVAVLFKNLVVGPLTNKCVKVTP